MAKQPLRVRSRTLTAADADLIGRVLTAEKALLDVQAEVASYLRLEHESKRIAAKRIYKIHNTNAEQSELDRFESAEPHGWASTGKRQIQAGVMALIRAIEQPG